MLSDEGQLQAAVIMREAAEKNERAANTFAESVNKLELLIGSGYGNNIEKLLEAFSDLKE
jgi:hypothetical protein